MFDEYAPHLICRLTDKNGKLLDPCLPGSIIYTELPRPGCCPGRPAGFPFDGLPACDRVTVKIEGFITVFIKDQRISWPIPFCMTRTVCMNALVKTPVRFATIGFYCHASPVFLDEDGPSLEIGVCVDSTAADSIAFRSNTCVVCHKMSLLRTCICQYNAVSDGEKRVYTDEDGIKGYGCSSILPPKSVSCYDLFVNGVLQPKVDYCVTKGCLRFITEDVPPKGVPITILFVSYLGRYGRPVTAQVSQYNARCDGVKKIYTDADELKAYGGRGIPAPDTVSYMNLYINAVLQPKNTYRVQKGLLELTTRDVPPEGTIIILQSITLRYPDGGRIRTDVGQYNAYSNGGKLYTDRDSIRMYGGQGIPDPCQNSLLNLFVNGALQPYANYSVKEGCLALKTTDAPDVGAPVILQFIRALCRCRSI